MSPWRRQNLTLFNSCEEAGAQAPKAKTLLRVGVQTGKKVKGRVKVAVSHFLLRWHRGTTQGPLHSQLVHLCLNEPVQSWRQWWGSLWPQSWLPGMRADLAMGKEERESCVVHFPPSLHSCSSWCLLLLEVLQVGQSNRIEIDLFLEHLLCVGT